MNDEPKANEEKVQGLTPTQLECWKTTVQTNQHFNTLQLQLRNFSITVFLAILTAVGFALKEHLCIPFGKFEVTLASFICLAGLIVVLAFYYMDWGYHQLLKGAVTHAGKIENLHKGNVPEIELSNTISTSSKGKKFLGFFSTDSTKRLRWYYGFMMVALIIIGVLSQCATGPASTAKEQTAPLPIQLTVQVPQTATQVTPPAATPAVAPTDTPVCASTALKRYYESGKYLTDVTQATDLGWMRVESHLKTLPPTEKAVVIFDIDETCLSSWPILNDGIFCWDAARFNQFVQEGRGIPIEPVRDLFKHLVEKKVAVILLSSRTEDQRDATLKNLEAAGFAGYTELILKGPKAGTTYKADSRKHIRDEGFRIVANVGDQLGDLDSMDPVNVLIPNPFYTNK